MSGSFLTSGVETTLGPAAAEADLAGGIGIWQCQAVRELAPYGVV